ncbi:MAG: type II toxin-antitoxin system YafQ family toxin [Bacteroidota bacterium]|nr:type II toxin-antitoxin system mRNA interferase toxin, RelE/StbE family [Odoribacter sp.]MDP3643621.1 type II toxin-antitoxin system YafQ family toxin [Bacteroidota bacterium]
MHEVFSFIYQSIKRDYKIIQKRNYPLNQIVTVFELLENNNDFPEKYHLHKLSGKYNDCWECHIRPDWLLIWRYNEKLKEIELIRTGTHSDLF